MKVQILTKNDCYKRGVPIEPKGIMMHSTGANNPTLKRYVGPDDGILGENIYGNHWNNPGLDVCVHAFIGETKDGTVECYQTLPWKMRSWHCGAEANGTHISIEICEDNRNHAEYFRATRDKALDVVSDLCMEFDFDPLAKGVLIDHSEGAAMGIASNHGDVTHWWSRFHYSMDEFRQDVSRRMKEKEEAMKEELKKLVQQEVAEAMKDIVIPEPDVSGAAEEAVDGLMSTWGTKDTHSDYSTQAIDWALENKLVNGREGGNYGWKKPITREEFITILYRVLNP